VSLVYAVQGLLDLAVPRLGHWGEPVVGCWRTKSFGKVRSAVMLHVDLYHLALGFFWICAEVCFFIPHWSDTGVLFLIEAPVGGNCLACMSCTFQELFQVLFVVAYSCSWNCLNKLVLFVRRYRFRKLCLLNALGFRYDTRSGG
jgi:hypothetical protein